MKPLKCHGHSAKVKVDVECRKKTALRRNFSYQTSTSWILWLILSSLPYVVSSKKIFCYYSSFAQTRQGPGNFLPEDIDPDLCTHVIYAFVDITPDGRDLVPFNRNDQGPEGLYARTLALKKQNPALKVLLAVGGWQIGSKPFIPMVRSDANRKAWVQNVIKYLRMHGFDGLDVDWEFPATRGSPPADKMRFTSLMKELFEAFAEEAQTTGQEKLILTMATASGTYYISQSYEPEKIIHYIDYMLLMTYNYHGQWEKTTGHHSGLHRHPSDPKNGEMSQLYQEWSIDYWLEVGISKDKLIVGIPTYAITFTLADQSQTGVGAPAIGGGGMGKYTKETGILAYYEICENLQREGWQSRWIEAQGVPYAIGQDQWAGYEDIRSVTLKAKNIMRRDLAGAFVWSVEMGDYDGTCGHGRYPLLNAINDVIRGNHRPQFSPVSRAQYAAHKTAPKHQVHQQLTTEVSTTEVPLKLQGTKKKKSKMKKTRRRNQSITSSASQQSKEPTEGGIVMSAQYPHYSKKLQAGIVAKNSNEGSSGQSSHKNLTSHSFRKMKEKWRQAQQKVSSKTKKWKKWVRMNKTAPTGQHTASSTADHRSNEVHNRKSSWVDLLPGSKWWPGYWSDEKDRINAQATGRPRYIPLGYTTERHTTELASTKSQAEISEAVADRQREQFSSSVASSDYCSVLGVGTFAHPKSCDHFIICLPGSWRKYPPHVMVCPVGTRFDADLKICNYASRVVC